MMTESAIGRCTRQVPVLALSSIMMGWGMLTVQLIASHITTVSLNTFFACMICRLFYREVT